MSYVEDIQAIVGEDRILLGEIDRICYSRDMSVHVGVPDMIVQPLTTEEVSEVLRIAYENDIPATPRGAGTSVTGASLACHGGIVLDLSKMNQLKEVNLDDMYVVVEPGLICGALNQMLAPNYFFPPDPGSSAIATLGGMVSTNASGVRAAKYGTTKDFVMGMEVVLMGGEVIRTGCRAPKNSSGYDLSRLFATSEGTLGVITEITLRILPNPPYAAFASACFDDLGDAGKAVSEIFRRGIELSACEILDDMSLQVVEDMMGIDVPDTKGMLLMEVDGHREAVLDNVHRIVDICREYNGKHVEWSDDPEERARVWAARGGLVPSLSRYIPGQRLIPIAEDFGVPMSKIPETINEIQEIARRHNITIATFGHVGDGNVHSTFVADVRDPQAWPKIRKVGEELLEMTIRKGGTITAEHGTGIAKSSFLRNEIGCGLDVMKRIKDTFDPKGLLNPGKVGLGEEADIFDYFAYTNILENPEAVKSLGEAADNEVLVCVECGFCRAACPIFAQKGVESANARGYVTLAFNLISGEVEPSAEVAEKFYRCADCMRCTAMCPAAIKVNQIVESARRFIVEAGYMPQAFQDVLSNIEAEGNPFGDPREKRTETMPAESRGLVREGDGRQPEVLVFAGCVNSYQDVSMVPAFMGILDAAHVDYAMLGEEEGCCGYIAYLSGSRDFEDIARATADRLSALGVDYIVTPCAGCYKTFAQLYPDHDIEMAPKVLHAVEYMDLLIDEGRLSFDRSFDKRVAYHDPCDLGRHLGMYDPPREVLLRIPGVELVEFPTHHKLAKCCGGGGGLKVTDVELSRDIAFDRIMEAISVDAEVVVSACPSCKDNLKLAADRARKEGKGKLRVLDITEVVRRTMAR
jgi:glycolate oxidase subunit GlcD